MKTGISVVVNCPEDKNHGKKGFTTLTGSYHSTVVFYDSKEQATIPNKFLKPCAHVTRPNEIKSEVLESIAGKIGRIIREVEAMKHSTQLHYDNSVKYRTDWAQATSKVLKIELEHKGEIIQMLNELLKQG
jgi:hypothetical protein